MVADIAALITDLKALRRGLGIQDPKLSTKAGCALRHVCGVTPEDPPGMVGKKVYTRLEHLLDQLPEIQRRLGRAVLGFEGGASGNYTDRLKMLGADTDRDVRTMQRRADDIIARIAELANLDDTDTPPWRNTPWHTTALQVILLLDRPEVEVLETRRIISHERNLTEIEHSMSVIPVAGLTEPIELSAFGIDVLTGGAVHSVRKVGTNRITFRLRFPRPIDIREHHELVLRVRLPHIAPFYACTPNHPCESFDLRARFGSAPPPRIWRIDGEFAIEADDPLPTRAGLHVDRTGEVRVAFRHLEPARSYGIGWERHTK